MVDWMMVPMSFGCMVFIAKTGLEHVYYVRDLQPEISALLTKASAFETRTVEEIELRTLARVRLSDLKAELRASELEL